MPLALLLIALLLWLALPVALSWQLTRQNQAGLPISALAVAGLQATFALIYFATQITTTSTQVYHDTYYTIGRFHYLGSIAILYAGTALFVALALKGAHGIPKCLVAPAFWSFHLGTGANVVTSLLAPLFMPHRYIDYPQALFWPNTISSLGAVLSMSALAALLLLTAIALLQTLTKREI